MSAGFGVSTARLREPETLVQAFAIGGSIMRLRAMKNVDPSDIETGNRQRLKFDNREQMRKVSCLVVSRPPGEDP